LAALAVAHLIALHIHGSGNPNGVASSGDRYAMYPYFIFKDLVTIFAFFLVLSIFVFYYPNALGQNWWPYIMLLKFYIIFTCAICWKYILYYYTSFNASCSSQQVFVNLIKLYYIKIITFKLNIINISFYLIINIVKIYNKTIYVSGYSIINFIRKFIIYTFNPDIVKYYYKIYNQQITKVINYLL
jgi:quinol-cytochrome oxidoreductase complex cytochrome b subunit